MKCKLSGITMFELSQIHCNNKTAIRKYWNERFPIRYLFLVYWYSKIYFTIETTEKEIFSCMYLISEHFTCFSDDYSNVCHETCQKPQTKPDIFSFSERFYSNFKGHFLLWHFVLLLLNINKSITNNKIFFKTVE